MRKMTDIDEIGRKLLNTHKYSRDEIEIIIPKLREIDRLRNEKDAVIMAHYYQIPPIQLIADRVGDSLALALAGHDSYLNGRLIISSTVYFMAEMIKILNPKSKVVIPDTKASCSIAEGMNASTVMRIRESYPDSSIVAYINTTAEVKSVVDVVCTSANADTIIKNMDGNPIILIPDYFFAKNIVKRITDDRKGRRYLAYKMIRDGNIVLEDLDSCREETIPLDKTDMPLLPEGTCIVHKRFTPIDIYEYKRLGVVDTIIAHPEVSPAVAEEVDMVGGTNKMISHLRDHPEFKRILFITECDMAAPLREAFPEREFFTPCRLCDYMRKNNLDNLVNSLINEEYEVTVDPDIAYGARRSLERMLELTGF